MGEGGERNFFPGVFQERRFCWGFGRGRGLKNSSKDKMNYLVRIIRLLLLLLLNLRIYLRRFG